MNEVGCFGKIPAHGDFVWHALPADFVTPWDNWIQATLLEFQQRRGEAWLEEYLRSNMWRFVLRDGAFGSASWCGVIAPSVDMVGRYFPFTAATSLPRNVSVVAAPRVLEGWFEHAENCVLAALQEALPLEDLLESVRQVPIADVGERDLAEPATGASPWSVIASEEEPWSDAMIEGIVYRQFSQPCYWSTLRGEGVQRVEISEGIEAFSSLFGD